MSPKKKLFEADDFDKKKKLFTPSDFDKEKEENNPIENPKDGNNGASDVSDGKYYSKIWRRMHQVLLHPPVWILRGIIGVCVICVICYFILSKPGDAPATEPEQETEIVEQTVVTIGSSTDQEKPAEEGLAAGENVLSNNADNHETKVNEASAAADNNSNIAAAVASSAIVSNDVEAEAMKVIRGDYGVGQERKDKLGAKYQTIQSRVNELKREGIF